jgi:hypothetical protein
MKFSPVSHHFLAARPGQTTNTYRILMVKLFGMHNYKIDLKMGCSGMDWIHLSQDRDQWRALVNTVTNFQVP